MKSLAIIGLIAGAIVLAIGTGLYIEARHHVQETNEAFELDLRFRGQSQWTPYHELQISRADNAKDEAQLVIAVGLGILLVSTLSWSPSKPT